jgi:branched-chain amino acid transport system permease protein
MIERLRERVGRAKAPLQRRRSPTVVLVIGFLLLAVLPFTLNITVSGVPISTFLTTQTLILALIWATAAQAWNITTGYTGMFSFGHAAFFGLGAYLPILLIEYFSVNPWIGMIAGGVTAGLYGLVVGGLCFRYDIRDEYFGLATLAFAELLRYVFLNASTLGGASGFVKPLPREYADGYGLLAFQFSSDLQYYYLVLFFLLVVTAVAFVIRYSRFGLYLFAIRENEAAAESLGIPTYRYKLAAFVVSAFFTAWVGAFWGMYFSSIRPEVVFDLLVNIEILLPAVVGGAGTVLGPIVGSLVVTPSAEVTRELANVPGADWIVYGGFLILIALYSPEGVVSWPERLVGMLSPSRGEDSDD